MDPVFPNLVEYTALIAGAVSVVVIALCWVRYYPERDQGKHAPPLHLAVSPPTMRSGWRRIDPL